MVCVAGAVFPGDGARLLRGGVPGLWARGGGGQGPSEERIYAAAESALAYLHEELGAPRERTVPQGSVTRGWCSGRDGEALLHLVREPEREAKGKLLRVIFGIRVCATPF